MDRTPKSGEFYRHFKDKLYQVIAVAEHTETGEALVIYQALYGDYRTYARPLAMFTGEVDHEKYPQVTQKYRFEKIEFPREAGETPAAGLKDMPAPQEPPLNPGLLALIEADCYEERMERLAGMHGKLSQADLDIIYVSLDMKRAEGSVEEQLHAVEQNLKMQRHYDGGHLR